MKFVLTALLGLLPFLSFAQNYWQQEVNYKIEVALDDTKHELTGTEEIEYVNNSPDALSFIYFHLWPNAYKNNKTALAKQVLMGSSRANHFAKPENRGYITNLAFEIDGQPAKLEYEQEDVAKLILNQPLQPGQRIRIRTPFLVKVPKAFSRLGHVDQSYQITQWYPKPAVYDRKGWHQMPYLDQGEFYSEFGKFDVKITLPANYTVGATGELQTASELARLDSLAAVSQDKTAFGDDMAFPVSASQTKTLHYVQDKIHDFAWFADKRFNVLKSSVELPVSKRKVTTWQMFLNKNADGWIKRRTDINDAIYYYSLHVGEYPYSAATAVDGALGANVGGMEYPMVTVTFPSAIIHEVGHNWFYGILASQERKHPWMDEGLNSYVESRIAEDKDPNAGQFSSVLKAPVNKFFGITDLHATPLNNLIYQVTGSRGADQPIDYPSEEYTSANYGGIVYQKSSVVLKYLANYLGQARFDSAMHAYYDAWKFKHPYPEDLQASFEQTTGEDLDWFFQHIIKTTQPVNVEIKREDAGPTGKIVTVKNESGYPVPVPVAALNEQGQVIEQHWTKPFSGTQTIAFNTTEADRYVIDPDYLLPELNRRDNQLRANGILKKTEKLRLQPLAGIEQFKKTQLYFTPVIGANTADKFMLGAAFYNSSLMAKKLNYVVMPMYSFDQNEVNGGLNINYNLVSRKGFLRQTIFAVGAQRYEYFRKIEPSITFNFRQQHRTSPKQQVKIAFTNIDQQDSKVDPIFKDLFSSLEPTVFPILHLPREVNGQTITYNIWKNNALQNIGFEFQFQHLGADPQKANDQSNAIRSTVNYKRYWSASKRFDVRLFGGKFFSQGDQPFVMGLSGSPDYLREHVFLDRAQKSEGMRALVDQTDGREGAFKNYNPVFTDDWLTTLNLETDLPYVPFAVYLDLGKVADRDNLFYGTGLTLNLGKDLFSLYLPLAGSNFANNTPENFKDFRQNIRFTLNLHKFNPFKLLNESF